MPKVKLPEGEGAVKPDCRVPQVLGDLGAKLEHLAIYRVFEGEPFGVQPETMAGDRIAVQRVSVDWVSDGREVDPDLVRPSRLEPYAQASYVLPQWQAPRSASRPAYLRQRP